jgi:pimeloyl-ACP methyl ester carboxylesterase
VKQILFSFGLLAFLASGLSASTVGHWRFENASAPGEDSGPNGLTLANGNGVLSVATPFPATLPGTSQSNALAGKFSVPDKRYLWIADTELFEFSDFTVEAYISPDSFGSGSDARAIASQMNTKTIGDSAWQFGLSGATSSLGARRPFLQISGNGTLLIAFSPEPSVSGSDFALTVGRNYYVAVTTRFTGTGIDTKFYVKDLTAASSPLRRINGTLSGTPALPSALFNSTARFAIGASHANGAASRFFDGTIDEVRISNSVLESTELLIGEAVGDAEPPEPPSPTHKTEILKYKSSVSTDSNGFLDLTAELNYDNARSNAPVMVLMHPFSGSSGHFSAYRPNAMRMRDAGFFVISPAMRGREGSDGVRDNGGLEIHDIYDAVEALKIAHPTLIDPTNISIIGYSGGGGNVMSALTKFPDYFRVGAAYYGISDYGYHPTNGWYFNGAGQRTPTLDASPGNPTPPAEQIVIDSYHARASNLASKNNPYSEVHLFVNDDETISPKVNAESYKAHAVAAEAFPGEFGNIKVHIGLPNVYQDFNGNGFNDPNELQYWPHANPSINQEQSGDLWYRARLLAGTIPEPVLNVSDDLLVAGYVKTKRFAFWLGDGQNAAGNLQYTLSQATKRFTFTKASVLPTSGKLTVDTSDTTGKTVEVRRNGTLIDAFTGGGSRAVENVVDGDVIEFTASVPPESSYETWREEMFGPGNPLLSGPLDDADHDGLLNLAEFAMKLDPKAADPVGSRPGATIVGESPGGNRSFDFKFRRRKGGSAAGNGYTADGVTYTIQTSTDLTDPGWSDDPAKFEVIGAPIDNGDGTETLTVRLTDPVEGKSFVRLKFTLAR